MMEQDSNNFDFDGFVSQFMREKVDSFCYTQQQLKIYPPLSLVCNKAFLSK